MGISQESHNRERGGRKGRNGYFIPTDEQRKKVKWLLGNGMSINAVAQRIINPRTLRCIDPQTLQEHFEEEIAEAGAYIQDIALTKLEESLEQGDWRPRQWFLENTGFGRGDNKFQLTYSGPTNPQAPIGQFTQEGDIKTLTLDDSVGAFSHGHGPKALEFHKSTWQEHADGSLWHGDKMVEPPTPPKGIDARVAAADRHQMPEYRMPEEAKPETNGNGIVKCDSNGAVDGNGKRLRRQW